MKIAIASFLLFFAVVISSCDEDGGLKGNITLSVTDSPIDADDVKSVNLFVNRVDIKNGGEWKSLKTFDQPVGFNLLEFSGGNSFPLITQSIDPGKYSAIRFTFNLADINSSLIRSPQCNISFEDGSTKPIYYFESGVADLVITQEMILNSRGESDFTFDFDIRKSLTRDEHDNYIFKPVVRTVETAKAGHIQATIANSNSADRLIVFAYGSGAFSSSEMATPPAGEVRFPNAITSFKVTDGKFGLGFLPSGNYDLIFARHSTSGDFISLEGRFNGVTVTAPETVQLEIDLSQLTGS